MLDSLRAAGIDPRNTNTGTQRLPCPRCAEVQHRTRDDALSLTIEPDDCCVWQCFRCGWSGNARPNGHRTTRRNIIQLATVKAEREATQHAERAAEATAIWMRAEPAPADHPYLVRKRLGPEGLRYVPRFQSIVRALIAPMRDASGVVVNVQGIDPQGAKRFLAGAKTRGAFACVGAWRKGHTPERIAIGEGWATVAAFVTDRPAYHGAAAMSALNLATVAEIMRARFAAAHIAILTDQDPAGIRAATLAARIVGAEMMLPGFAARGVNDFADARTMSA